MAEILLAFDPHLATGGLFQPRQLVERVDLPEPEVPRIQHHLSFFNLQIDAMEGHHLFGAHPIGLSQVHRFDDLQTISSLSSCVRIDQIVLLYYNTLVQLSATLFTNYLLLFTVCLNSV